MRMIRPICALAATSLLMAAGSPDQIVRQRGRVFSSDSITVTQGQQVVFLNDDTVPHNIISLSTENGFDLGSQVPGTATPVSFDAAGTVLVICAIHPRMHMTIIVTK